MYLFLAHVVRNVQNAIQAKLVRNFVAIFRNNGAKRKIFRQAKFSKEKLKTTGFERSL